MSHASPVRGPRTSSLTESPTARRLLIGSALTFVTVFLLLPLGAVFTYALRDGVTGYVNAIRQPDTLAAIRLTLLAAVISVPMNTVFGVAAAWLLARFRFPGRSVLLTLIDLPFSVSPVVAGLCLVLLFGRQGWMGAWLSAHDVRILFAVPGIVMATTFVTFPMVAREVLAVLQSHGSAEEESALTLGAGPWRMFWSVTLPKIRWGLLYGVVLTNARAMGEFGAVSVVSGHIRGLTNTLPLHAEILYNEYNAVGAFSVASLLTLLAVVTLVLKKLAEGKAVSP